MRTRHPLWIGLVAGLLMLAACSGNQSTPTPAQSVSTTTETGAAQITGFEILKVAAAPPDVRVVARGQLADGCTRLETPVVQRQGQTFQITISTVRVAQAACPPGPVDFERVIALDLAGVAPGAYTVSVNGLTSSFDLPADGGGAAPAPAPTSTPEAVAPTEAPQPAPTTEAPTPAPAPTSAPAAQTGCLDKIAFFGDVTVPDDTAFNQGETFVKTWKFRNEGTCTLNSSYALVFGGGDLMSGPQKQPLEGSIPPGGIFEVSVKLTAPNRGGPHVGNWHFHNPHGQAIGVGASGKDLFWVRIAVNYTGVASGQAAVVTSGGSSGGSGGCGAQQNAAYQSQVLSLINGVRAQNGLSALTPQGPLAAAALKHSRDMACNNFVDHTGTDGSTWFTRIQAQGYAYSDALENIYVGSPDFGGTPDGAFDWWMNSTIHRNNILNAKVTSIGVAYVFNPASTYGGYYTVVFARP
jgi:uncharacterized protein YkwD